MIINKIICIWEKSDLLEGKKQRYTVSSIWFWAMALFFLPFWLHAPSQWIPNQSINLWMSLESMDITKCCFFPWDTLQTFSTAIFSPACFWVTLWVKHALLSLDQVTNLATEEYPVSLPLETLGYCLQYVSGHFPFALQSAV